MTKNRYLEKIWKAAAVYDTNVLSQCIWLLYDKKTQIKHMWFIGNGILLEKVDIQLYSQNSTLRRDACGREANNEPYQWRIHRGFRVRPNPLSAPVLKYPMQMK